MASGIIKFLPSKGHINFTKLTTYIAIIITIVSLISIYIGSVIIKEKAIRDLARQEAKQTSQFVFQSLYSAMRKGWTKNEIKDIIHRLNNVQPDLEVIVVRGEPVIRQFGEIEGEKEIREKDPLIMKALKGEATLLKDSSFIRYYYPVAATKECLQCHNIKEGDINGVIKVSYPIHNLKVSLEFLINAGFISLVVFITATFIIFYFAVRGFIINPMLNLINVISEIATEADLNKRIPQTSYISEILYLTNHFNKLLTTVQEYYTKLEELSIRDPLTKFFNRRKYEELFEYEIGRSGRHKHRFTIVTIDLDNFKHINDTYGHPIGDIVIKGVASLIKQNIRKSDIAARIGGDEFSLILLETPVGNGVIVVEKLRKVLRETPIDIMTGTLIVKASFGVAEYPSHGQTLNELTVASNMALYRAKHLGRDTVAVLEEGITEAKMDMVSKADDIKRAIEEDRIEPFFQPVIDVKTDCTFGLDIATRIKDKGSFILAGQFKNIADELGYMEKIDAQIFLKVLSLTEALEKKYGEGVKLFFELSAKRFFADDFTEDVLETLKRHNCPGDRIVFEITEHDTLANINRFMEIVKKLKENGIRFSLKNFGSGFSSFMYLKYLDVSYVKIEGELIRAMDVDNRNKILVKNIHQILAQFGITDIAEYVEDKDVAQIVTDMGIQLGQGFYYGNPEGV